VATRDELDAWIVATAPRAVAYARSLLKNVHEAEDVVQACYCRLLQKASDYDLLIDGQKLLLKAVTNACINLKSRRGPFVRLVHGEVYDDMAYDPADVAAVMPSDLAAAAELCDAVAAGLRQLPEMQRAAVELKALSHSQQEIADILGTTTSNAGVLIYRGRQAMALMLAPFLSSEVRP